MTIQIAEPYPLLLVQIPLKSLVFVLKSSAPSKKEFALCPSRKSSLMPFTVTQALSSVMMSSPSPLMWPGSCIKAFTVLEMEHFHFLGYKFKINWTELNCCKWIVIDEVMR